VVVWWCGGVVWWCGGGGWFPLAFEHSKVCTLCDFGHKKRFIYSSKQSAINKCKEFLLLLKAIFSTFSN
jgi:hypothetical protein